MSSGLSEVPASGVLATPPFQYYLFLACATCLLVVLFPLAIAVRGRTRRMPTAENLKALSWYLRSSIAYLIVNSLEVLVPTEAATLFFMKLCYLLITSIPLWLFFFSLSITGREALARQNTLLPWIFPVINFLVVFTNERHHLNWGELVSFRSGPFLVIRALSYGPWFWFVWVSMQVAVVVSATMIVLSVFSKARTLNRQSLIIVVGALIPITVNGAYVVKLVPGWQKDFSAIAFGFSGILFAFGILRDRLFDLVPIARRILVEALSDPLVVVDEDGRIVDANPAAQSVCGLGDAPMGMATTVSPFLASVVELLHADSGTSVDDGGGTDLSPDGVNWYEVRATEIPSWGNRAFRLYAMRDITESRRLMDEKSALVERLSRALADIRTLQGIVPICASCKKIRDDSGYWQQVESYVASHTMAEFSLGLCPNCRTRQYAEQNRGEEIDGGGKL